MKALVLAGGFPQIELLKQLQKAGIHTAVDTCGNVPWANIEKALPYCDTWLYDVKCADSETHRRCTGCDNRRILENLEKLGKTGANIWIRVPVIPDFNTEENQQRSRATLEAMGIRNFDLFTYRTE